MRFVMHRVTKVLEFCKYKAFLKSDFKWLSVFMGFAGGLFTKIQEFCEYKDIYKPISEKRVGKMCMAS